VLQALFADKPTDTSINESINLSKHNAIYQYRAIQCRELTVDGSRLIHW